MASFDWLTWSNPIALWWGLLLLVSSLNISIWLWLRPRLRARGLALIATLSAAYVFGCAFRAVLPRADVQRICLFDTWLSSVLVGRSVATVAELCFAAQWALVVRHLATVAQAPTSRRIADAVVPAIAVAECCSWYAVITTDYLGNAVENSIWALTFLAIAAALLLLIDRLMGAVQIAIAAMATGILAYVAFLATVDIPTYVERWRADVLDHKPLLGLLAGLRDAATHWVVAHDAVAWDGELLWMGLYFSAAVWASLALCGFMLTTHDRLPSFLARAARPRLAGPAHFRPLPK